MSYENILSEFTVTEKATRPGRPGFPGCFYCSQPIGGLHKTDCVLIQQKVKLMVMIELETTEPASWTKQHIECARNEGTWCSDNLMREFEKIIESDGCLCNRTRVLVLDFPGGAFLNEEGKE